MPFGRGASPRSRRAAYRIRMLRRVVAAALAGVAVWAAVRVLVPAPAVGTVSAVVAAHDLAAGALLRAEDLTVALRDPSELPREAMSEPAALLGRTLAGPATQGEVLTSARLRGPGLLTGQPPGAVAVGVPLADATLVRSLRAGDSVSVHGVGAAAQVARGTVLAVEQDEAPALSGQGGRSTVVLAVPENAAAVLAAVLGGPSAGLVLALHR